MPRIPDEFSLGGLPSLNSGRPIATYDTSSIGKGVAALGKGLESLGGSLGEVSDRADEAQYLQAKADYTVDNIGLNSKIGEDTDYSTIAKRFGDQAEQSRQEKAATIANPRLRERFLRETETSVAQTQSNAYLHGVRLQGNAEVAYTRQQGDRSLELAAGPITDAQRGELITAHNARIDALVAKGAITPTAALDEKRRFAMGAAGAAFDRLPASDRIQLIERAEKETPTLPATGTNQQQAIVGAAQRLGIQPRDLAAAISYETGGKFDTNLWGGKGGNYLGLIQFGPEERRKYGIRPGMKFEQQMEGVEAFLRDRGVKPGMGISEIYRTINGGNPNASLNASDGNGTIGQHIERIKSGHYASADNFLNGSGPVPEAPKTGTALDFIPRDRWDALRRRAELDLRADDTDRQRAEVLKAREAKRVSDEAEDGIFKNIVLQQNGQLPPGTQPVTAASIVADNNGLTREAKERLVRLVGTTAKDHDASTYGKNFYDLFQRVHADPNDPTRLTDPAELYQYVGHDKGLTLAGMQKLRDEIAGKRTPEGDAEASLKKQFFAGAKAQISGTDPLLHLKDPKGEELFLKFMAQTEADYARLRKEGKTAAQLFNPDNPDYLGKTIGTFKRKPEQMFADMIQDQPAAETSKPFDIGSIKTLDEAQAAFRSGQISAAQARSLAIERGWARPRPEPAALPQVPRF